jgi:hypothetical protein
MVEETAAAVVVDDDDARHFMSLFVQFTWCAIH